MDIQFLNMVFNNGNRVERFMLDKKNEIQVKLKILKYEKILFLIIRNIAEIKMIYQKS